MLTTLHYCSQLIANSLSCRAVTTVTVRLNDTAVLVRDDRDPAASLPASLLRVIPPAGVVRVMAASGNVARVQQVGGKVQDATNNPLGQHGLAVNWTPSVMPTRSGLLARMIDLAQLATGKTLRLRDADGMAEVRAVQPPTLRGLLDARLALAKLKPIAVLDIETRNCQAVVAWTKRVEPFSVRSFVGVWPTVRGPHIDALQKLIVNALLDRAKVSLLCGEVGCGDVLCGTVGFLRARGDVEPVFSSDGLSVTNRELETLVRAELEPHIDRWLGKDKTIAKTVIDRAVARRGRR